VLTDFLEPLVGYAPAAGHVLQEGQHVVGLLGATEGEQQDGVVRSRIRGWIRRRLDGHTSMIPGAP
jgi:hypothetical protein